MKKIFIFTTMAFLLIGNAEVFAQKGDFEKAKKYHNSAVSRKQKFGENDKKVLDLYTKAINEYQKCVSVSDKNTGEAYHYLARLLFTGPKSLINKELSLKYFLTALEIYEKERKGIPLLSSCYKEIGSFYYRAEDFYSAFRYYQKAAELNGIYAGDVACMYWLGLGVEQNLPQAMEIYRQACLRGIDLWANIYALAYHIKEYEKGNYESKAIELFLDYMHLKGMNEDKSVWMSKIQQSADLDYPPAQYELWISCRNDNAHSKGMTYLQKAVDAGYVPAFFEMGYAYAHKGFGKPVNYYEAQRWYEKASMEGHPLAQNNLGAMYYNNQIAADGGYSNNQEMLAFWWNTAAEQGLAKAIQNQKLITRYLTPQQRNALNAQLILNSIADAINASTELYNTLNKSKMQAYTPPNNRQTGNSTSSNNSSSQSTTSSTTTQPNTEKRDQMCPSKNCNGGVCVAGLGLRTCSGGSIECSTCSGKGYYLQNGKNTECINCKGKGKTKCSVCNGTGKCQQCKGTGRIK